MPPPLAGYPVEKELSLEDMAMPEPRILYAQKQQEDYLFGVDTGMLYGGFRHRRPPWAAWNRGRLPSTDTWTFPQAHPLQVTWLSHEPWILNEQEGTAVSGRKTLRVTCSGSWSFQTEDGLVSHDLTPLYVLRILTEPDMRHTVQSEISWSCQTPFPTKYWAGKRGDSPRSAGWGRYPLGSRSPAPMSWKTPFISAATPG